MEGSVVGSIPRVLLARILLQLYVIPQHYFDNPGDVLIRILVAGLQKYGETSDLSGLLKFCLHEAEEANRAAGGKQTDWWWKDLGVSRESDWDRLDLAYPIGKSEPVNLHVEILNEEGRKGAVHIKYAKQVPELKDKRLFYSHEDVSIPIDSILYSTLTYLGKCKQPSEGSEEVAATATLTHLIEKRLEKFARERYEQKQQIQNSRISSHRVNSDYILMGALMRRRCDDMAVISGSEVQEQWCLYLRDYISSDSGTIWRVVSEATMHNREQTPEIKIPAPQALADIRGAPTPTDDDKIILQPSEWSKNFRPVYLFYCNRELVARSLNDTTAAAVAGPSAQNEEENLGDAGGVITYEDYLFDEDMMDYVPQDEEDDSVCKVCGIPEIVEDVNNIFFCDECNQGVHQMCANPPIDSFEVDLTPWYCRECSRAKGLPIPQRLVGASNPDNGDKENALPGDVLGIKRKREE